MDRRRFLGIAAFLLAEKAVECSIPALALARPRRRKRRQAKKDYGLDVVVDEGKKLSKAYSAKAVRIAQYILDQRARAGVSYIDESTEGCQTIRAQLKIGGWEYDVYVNNHENGGSMLDSITIWKSREYKLYKFVDSGFDGNCNMGTAPPKEGEVVSIHYHEHSSQGERKMFDKHYRKTLDQLIRFYGNGRR